MKGLLAPSSAHSAEDLFSWIVELVGEGVFEWDEEAIRGGFLNPLRIYTRQAARSLPVSVASCLLEAVDEDARDHEPLLAALILWMAGGALAEETLFLGRSSIQREPYYLSSDIGSALTLSMTAQNMSRAFLFNHMGRADRDTRISLHHEIARGLTAWSLGLGYESKWRGGNRGPVPEKAYLSRVRCSTLACGLRLAVLWTSGLFRRLKSAAPALLRYGDCVAVSRALDLERKFSRCSPEHLGFSMDVGSRKGGRSSRLKIKADFWRGQALREAARSGLDEKSIGTLKAIAGEGNIRPSLNRSRL